MYEPQVDEHCAQSVIVQHSPVLQQHIGGASSSLNSPSNDVYQTPRCYEQYTRSMSAPMTNYSLANRRRSDSDLSNAVMSREPSSPPIMPQQAAMFHRTSDGNMSSSISSSQQHVYCPTPGPSLACESDSMSSPPNITLNSPPDTPVEMSPEVPHIARKDRCVTRNGGGKLGVAVAPTVYPCAICNDRSTGKHYGAFSCDGCKGFFRRSIRKKHNYTCRFNRNCVITKDRRNQCRYCRLKKCITSGMKKEAVQNERDRITQRRSPADVSGNYTAPSEGSLTMAILINAETLCKQHCPNRDDLQSSEAHRERATVDDVAKSVKQQLLVLVEWAKAIPCFTNLNIEDRIKLLKAHSGEHLLMGTAWRSRFTDNNLLLGNDMLIPRLDAKKQTEEKKLQGDDLTNYTPDGVSSRDISWVASRVLDDVVTPLKQNCVDEKEFMCLRTMIFFDPMLHGLVNRESIHGIRLEAQLLLEDYISERQDVDPRGRFGQMMFMLPYLQSIATAMIQQIQYAKMDGLTEIEPLIQEMLLGSLTEEAEKEGFCFPPPVVAPVVMLSRRNRRYYCDKCDDYVNTYHRSEGNQHLHEQVNEPSHDNMSDRREVEFSEAQNIGESSSMHCVDHFPSACEQPCDLSHQGNFTPSKSNFHDKDKRGYNLSKTHHSPFYNNDFEKGTCNSSTCGLTSKSQTYLDDLDITKESNSFDQISTLNRKRASVIPFQSQTESKFNEPMSRYDLPSTSGCSRIKSTQKCSSMFNMTDQPYDLSPYSTSSYSSTGSEAPSPGC